MSSSNFKNQHFQIPIRSGTHGHVSTSSYELLSDPWVNKLQFTIFTIFSSQERPSNFATYVPHLLSPPAKIWIVCILFSHQLNHRPSGRNQFFLCVSKTNECFIADAPGGTPGNSWWWCAAGSSNPDPLDLFRPKNVIFHNRFHTRPLKSIPDPIRPDF